jgi:hypothetical protein
MFAIRPTHVLTFMLLSPGCSIGALAGLTSSGNDRAPAPPAAQRPRVASPGAASAAAPAEPKEEKKKVVPIGPRTRDELLVELGGSKPSYPDLNLERAREALAELRGAKEARLAADEVLLEVVRSSLVGFRDTRQADEALALLDEAYRTVQVPGNVGDVDEHDSASFRALIVTIDEARTAIKRGVYARVVSDAERAEKQLAAHEAEFLAGQPSPRGRAMLEQMKAVATTYAARAKKQQDGARKFYNDPAYDRLTKQRETLLREAKILMAQGDVHSLLCHDREEAPTTFEERACAKRRQAEAITKKLEALERKYGMRD